MTKQIIKQIGEVGVDSGQLVICDPCYIDSEWKHLKNEVNSDEIFRPEHKGRFNYGGCCQATIEEVGGQLNFELGYAGAGVAVSSGFGDGNYPVFAKVKNYGTDKNPDFRVKEVIIKFIED